MLVLVVDDDDFALQAADRTLKRLGHTVVQARGGEEAMEILRKGEARLMITDWMMPGMDGIELCRAARREDLPGYVYIIMLTGQQGAKQRLAGLYAGADDFLVKPLDMEELQVCLKTAERILSMETREVALFALAKLAESRDPDTGAHIERVQSYSRALARNLSPRVQTAQGVDDDYVRLLYQTSPLHDLGKVGIPDAVLLKRGKLTPAEFAIMKTHTELGERTLSAALERFPQAGFLQMARDIAAGHHEHFDGTGYPRGLAGEQIPLCARIVAVADVYDAMTSRRIYKSEMSHQAAREEILAGRGTHFDPEVVDAFLRAEDKFIAIHIQLSDDVELPHEGMEPPVQSPAAMPADQSGAPDTIMVVGNDAEEMKLLAGVLAATGAAVCTADARAALRVMAERRPRLVLSNWSMPNINGIDLCRRIRAEEGGGDVFFIMLTSQGDKNRLLEAYEAGANDFVAKPFETQELLARVRAGLRTARIHGEHAARSSSAALTTQLVTLNSRLEKLTVSDELTGLFNRRHAMSWLDEQWNVAERHHQPLTLVMIDVDRFTSVSEALGHDAGNAVLQQLAMILRQQRRATDALCRLGGDEFLIILPGASLEMGLACAERCRAAVERAAFLVAGRETRLTISAGVACRHTHMGYATELVKAAEESLGAAKGAGRNVVRANEPAARQEHDPAPAAQSAPAAPQPPIDLAGVLKRCGGDTVFASGLLERFVAQAPSEADAIDTAISLGEIERLRLSAHSLKSMAAYVGAQEVSEIARQIEALAKQGQPKKAAALINPLRAEMRRAIQWIQGNAKARLARCA
jgi:putative two-component system response regulator